MAEYFQIQRIYLKMFTESITFSSEFSSLFSKLVSSLVLFQPQDGTMNALNSSVTILFSCSVTCLVTPEKSHLRA